MTFEDYILKQRPICQLPLCCRPSSKVLDPHTPEMLAVCDIHAELDESNDVQISTLNSQLINFLG